MRKTGLPLLVFLAIYFHGNAQVDSLKNELKRSKSDTLSARILINLGRAHTDYDSALFYFKKAANISTENSPYFRGLAFSEMAVKHFRQNEMDSAFQRWEKAKTWLAESRTDKNEKEVESKIGEINYQMAVPHYYAGRYGEALAQLHIALELLEKHNYEKRIISCYSLLGIIHFAQDEMNLAEKQLTYAISFALEKKYSGSLENLYNNLASVYLENKDFEAAKNKYLESHKHIPEEDLLSKAQVNMNIGLTYLRMKDYEKAKEYLLKDKVFFENTTHLRTKITWRNMLGELYLAFESWDKLIENSKRTLAELEEMPLAIIKKSALDQLSRGYEGKQEYSLALKYYKEHVQLQDSLFSEEKTKEIERLEAQLEFDEKEREISELTEANLKQEVALGEERNTRNMILFLSGGTLLLFALILIQFRRSEEKRRHHLELKRAEIEQRMLRSQMNPHFIFNALNSIQSFITTNNTYEAEVFMSKFSMLVRKILENSTHKQIPLEEEVETLRLYLELEKSRFEERFDFEIMENADAMLSIPPMLLQPFIENAIIHGMKDKREKGHIHVRFEEEENCLRCEVEDDGVGRKNATKEATHRSLATTLTNDRISYFNETLNSVEYNLQIIDLTNDHGNACGTKVVLTIPLVA